jgi:hypothetical protein
MHNRSVQGIRCKWTQTPCHDDLLNIESKRAQGRENHKKMLKHRCRQISLLTDEVDDEAAVAGAAGGAAKERPPVRRRAVGAGVPRRRQADVVAGVRQRVSEAEDARIAAHRRRAIARKDKQERPPQRHMQCQRRGGGRRMVPWQRPHV